jgi:hypothetical protein
MRRHRITAPFAPPTIAPKVSPNSTSPGGAIPKIARRPDEPVDTERSVIMFLDLNAVGIGCRHF